MRLVYRPAFIVTDYRHTSLHSPMDVNRKNTVNDCPLNRRPLRGRTKSTSLTTQRSTSTYTLGRWGDHNRRTGGEHDLTTSQEESRARDSDIDQQSILSPVLQGDLPTRNSGSLTLNIALGNDKCVHFRSPTTYHGDKHWLSHI